MVILQNPSSVLDIKVLLVCDFMVYGISLIISLCIEMLVFWLEIDRQ